MIKKIFKFLKDFITGHSDDDEAEYWETMF